MSMKLKSRSTLAYRNSRFLPILLCVALPLIAGCGRKVETTTETAPAAPAAIPNLKVALITPDSISDNGWNAGAYKALQDVKTTTGAEVQNVEAKTPDAWQENLRAYAVKNFNVVIAHGSEMEDTTIAVAKDFPNTQFLIDSGRKSAPNVTPIVLRMEDSAYLMGMLAAGMSRTGKIGSVGAQKGAELEAIFSAYAAGAKAVKPGITIIPTAYTNDWTDVAKGKAQTLALLDQGADVIIGDLDAAAPGVFDAAKSRTTADKPVYVFATSKDQNADAPDVILASAPLYIEKAYIPITQQIKAGTYKYSGESYGLKSGVIGFILNPALQAKIPADVKAKVDDAQKQIMAGTLDVTKG